jgi:hypothetical protein
MVANRAYFFLGSFRLCYLYKTRKIEHSIKEDFGGDSEL